MQHKEMHRTHRIGWLRAAVLGANDGIVSTASLVIGVAASGSTHSEVLVAGLAGLVAGAMSMAAGEYVSVSSQADTESADLERERGELRDDPRTRARGAERHLPRARARCRSRPPGGAGASPPTTRSVRTPATSWASPPRRRPSGPGRVHVGGDLRGRCRAAVARRHGRERVRADRRGRRHRDRGPRRPGPSARRPAARPSSPPLSASRSGACIARMVRDRADRPSAFGARRPSRPADAHDRSASRLRERRVTNHQDVCAAQRLR